MHLHIIYTCTMSCSIAWSCSELLKVVVLIDNKLELLKIQLVESKAVEVIWRGDEQVSTAFRYECLFRETGSIVYYNVFTLPARVTSTRVSVCVEDTVPEYQHRVMVTQITPGGHNQVTRTFDLGIL